MAEDTAARVKQRRRALLLHHAGPDVQDLFLTLPNTGDATDYNAAKTALNTYFIPQTNDACAHRAFELLQPNAGETMRQFATRLRHGIRDCEYTAAEADKQIGDSIIKKCKSDSLRRKLLEEGRNLTLARTLECAEQCDQHRGTHGSPVNLNNKWSNKRSNRKSSQKPGKSGSYRRRKTKDWGSQREKAGADTR